MALIMSSKRNDDDIVLSVKMNVNEANSLKSMTGNVFLISDQGADTKSNLYERGRKGTTKYFLLPKHLRENIRLRKDVSCLKCESSKKIMWVFFMDKF